MADDTLSDLLDDTSEEREDQALDTFLGEDPLTDDLLDAASDAAPPATIGYVEPLMDLPPNQASMECLRGPCQFHWHISSRMPAPGRDDLDIRVASNRHCTHHEGVVLNSKNVFRCTRWWPAPLAFVPEFTRSMLRQFLREVWERQLVRKGYDLSWRIWPDDLWELADRPEYRHKLSLDGELRPPTLQDFQKKVRAARRAAQKGPSAK